jgi:ADP-heptose:LPS heptosyltransferase
MAQSKSGRILVVRGGAIGDFILTLPVFSVLRKQFPTITLDVLGYPNVAQLALVGNLVDEVRSIEAQALAGFFARKNPKLDEGLTQYFSKFEMIISFLFDPDRIFQDNVARCSDAQFIKGPHRPDETQPLHATETFLKPLEQLTIFDADPVPQLVLPLAAQVQLPPGQWIAVHPGSGSPLKNWPETNWINTLQYIINESPWSFALIGGEAEVDRINHLAEILPLDRRKVILNRPLPEVAQWLSLCQAFVGHDSGITHLASALNKPGLVLWGETVESVWKPLSERMTLIKGDPGIQDISIQTVINAMVELMDRWGGGD